MKIKKGLISMRYRIEVKGIRVGTRNFMCDLDYKYETYIIEADSEDKAKKIATVSLIYDYGDFEYINIIRSEVI